MCLCVCLSVSVCACACVCASGSKQDFNERYNSFFIDYSLLPLLVQQNYIDSSQHGIMR